MVLRSGIFMTVQILESTIAVQLAGEAALAGLARASRLEVLSVVSQALYLRSGADELCWITGENSPMHRRSLHIASPLPKLPVGAVLDVRDRADRLDAGACLDLSRAQIWSAAAVRPERTIPLAYLVQRADQFFHQLLEGQQPAGLGCLLPVLLQKLAGAQCTPAFDPRDVFLVAAWPFIDQITSALPRHAFDDLFQPGLHLAGLGQGLTPSGDDFLGGLFFCLASLGQAFPDLGLPDHTHYSEFILHCKGSTNPISFALLEDHFRGHSLEPMHQILHGLLDGGPVEALLAPGQAMTRLGHSTGWDILTGFLAGLFVTRAGIPLTRSS